MPLLVVLVLTALVIVIWSLVDLARHQVRTGPRWLWAVICLASFPIGVILYWTFARVPPGERAIPDRAGPPLPPPSAGTMGVGAGRTIAPADPRPPRAGSTGPPVIATHDLTKRYGDTAALDRVTMTVPRGATYGLIGPNGAGKTTMLSIVAGLRHPTSGRLDLGVERRSMGLLVDTPLFEPWLTAREVVDLARHLTAPELPAARVDQVLAQVGLAEAADRRNGGFSRGMLQRLGLAGALVGDPEVLVLDEPSSALDPAGRREVLDLVGRLAHTKTVILSTHILADVQQVCDTVGVIDRGRLVFEGSMDELLARTASSYLVHVRPPADGLVEALAHQGWVTEAAELAPGRVRVTVTDAGRAETEIPALLAARGLALVSFNPATDLETAFLELTG